MALVFQTLQNAHDSMTCSQNGLGYQKCLEEVLAYPAVSDFSILSKIFISRIMTLKTKTAPKQELGIFWLGITKTYP